MTTRFIIHIWGTKADTSSDRTGFFLRGRHGRRCTYLRAILWLATLAFIAGGLGFGGSAEAVCMLKVAPLKSEVLDRYEKSPNWLLKDYPIGGYGLSNLVSQMAARKAENVALIFTVSANAKADQQVSIGIGLYKTESGCQTQDSNISKAIDTAIANSGQDALIRAYNLALGDLANTSSTTTIPTSQQAAPQQLPADVTSAPTIPDPFDPLPDPFGPPSKWQ